MRRFIAKLKSGEFAILESVPEIPDKSKLIAKFEHLEEARLALRSERRVCNCNQCNTDRKTISF